MSAYEIRIKTHSGRRLPEWLDYAERLDPGDGETVISVDFVDQASLRNLLVELRNQGFSLVSVVRDESSKETHTDSRVSKQAIHESRGSERSP